MTAMYTLPAGTRVRSLRDDVPGVPFLTGYFGEVGTVVVDEAEELLEDSDWAFVRFDNDPNEPYIETAPNGIHGPSPVWAWDLESLEVIDPPTRTGASA